MPSRSIRNPNEHATPAGGIPRVVLEAPWLESPAWSPDGLRLAIARGDGTDSVVLLNPVDGSTALLVTDGATSLVWDPSGSARAGFFGHDLVVVRRMDRPSRSSPR